MDAAQLYHFLFETYEGIGVLIGAGLVISLIASVIMERRTRKTFVDREPSKDDWSLFDDDEEEEEQPAPKAPKKAASAQGKK
ncbi:DUF6724 family protein [Xiamenia xianingshaonis]|uniref:Uncharacterized protein n=1 Tax=Xiamenia xianingshaonis TaxID=2682776 RepID=A0A9E6MR66_9ACTN|nr:DUF6724 family protein [Xiamenia xianingshaonis]NHM13445.1 hypothetical protein [Xiamenia xianingshaonis]NHM15129.1 hypothetical protein [Xiamenia xianingshaonis]QTU84477.1 hypothetical protein J7S26_00645 [Xiamenia xianingshaonis]